MAEDDEEYEVDAILDHRRMDNQMLEFWVHWKGYPDSDNSWVPWDNMECAELIDEYFSQIDPNKEKKKEKRQSKAGSKDRSSTPRSISPGPCTSSTSTKDKKRRTDGEPVPKKKKILADETPSPKKKINADTPSSTTGTPKKIQQSESKKAGTSKSRERVSSTTVETKKEKTKGMKSVKGGKSNLQKGHEETDKTTEQDTPKSPLQPKPAEKTAPQQTNNADKDVAQPTPAIPVLPKNIKVKILPPKIPEVPKKIVKSTQQTALVQEMSKEAPASTVAAPGEQPHKKNGTPSNEPNQKNVSRQTEDIPTGSLQLAPETPKASKGSEEKKKDGEHPEKADDATLPALSKLPEKSMENVSSEIANAPLEPQNSETSDGYKEEVSEKLPDIQKKPDEPSPECILPDVSKNDLLIESVPTKLPESVTENVIDKESTDAATAELAQLNLTVSGSSPCNQQTHEEILSPTEVQAENEAVTPEENESPGLLIDEHMEEEEEEEEEVPVEPEVVQPSASTNGEGSANLPEADDDVMSESVRRRMAKKAEFAARATSGYVRPQVVQEKKKRPPPRQRTFYPDNEEDWEDHSFLLSSTSQQPPSLAIITEEPSTEKPAIDDNDKFEENISVHAEDDDERKVLKHKRSNNAKFFKPSRYNGESSDDESSESEDDDDLTDYEDVYSDDPKKIPLRQQISKNPYERGMKSQRIFGFCMIEGACYAGVLFHGSTVIENIEYNMLKRLDPILLTNYFVKIHKRCLARGIDVNGPWGLMPMFSDEESDNEF